MWLEPTAAHRSTTGRTRSNAPSIRPAANSTASSINPSAEPSNHPRIPRKRRKLKHLGLPAAPARSTLAYANEHRPWPLYQTVFEQLLEKCQSVVASQPGKTKRKFRFKNKLLSLDATVISLCVSVFDWAQFRRTKGAVKLHLLLDHDGHLPSYAVLTEGQQHEVRVARQLQFAPGTVLVIDRGYTDYEWFAGLTQEGVYLVTRLKDNAD